MTGSTYLLDTVIMMSDQTERMDRLEDDFAHLARVFLSLVEGDTHLLDDAYEILKRRGIVDEDGFEQ